MLALEKFIALRYFKSGRKERFMSVITVIATLGVSLGVAALIITSSIMNGFERDLRNALIGANAHLTISSLIDMPASQTFRKEVVQKIVETPNVVRQTPFLVNQAILVGRDSKSSGSLVRGLEIKQEVNHLDLVRSFKTQHITNDDGANSDDKQKIKAGQLILKNLQNQHDYQPDPTVPNQKLQGIVLGYTLSKNLGVATGDSLILIPPESKISPFGPLPKPKKLLVIGIYKSGLAGYDEVLAFVSLKTAQTIFNKKDNYTGLSVYLNDPYQAEKVGEQISEKLGFPYFVTTWIEDNANVFAVLLVEKYALTLVLFIIILVAAFNIITSLIMLVQEKRRDIAILKTMGATNQNILKIFMLQGIAIGSIGTISGFLVGVFICWVIKNYDIVKIPDGVYVNNRMPMYMDWWQILLFLGASMAICFLVTFIPAKKAAKTNPIDILRYE